jgi:hypothetical protein
MVQDFAGVGELMHDSAVSTYRFGEHPDDDGNVGI